MAGAADRAQAHCAAGVQACAGPSRHRVRRAAGRQSYRAGSEAQDRRSPGRALIKCWRGRAGWRRPLRCAARPTVQRGRRRRRAWEERARTIGECGGKPGVTGSVRFCSLVAGRVEFHPPTFCIVADFLAHGASLPHGPLERRSADCRECRSRCLSSTRSDWRSPATISSFKARRVPIPTRPTGCSRRRRHTVPRERRWPTPHRAHPVSLLPMRIWNFEEILPANCERFVWRFVLLAP